MLSCDGLLNIYNVIAVQSQASVAKQGISRREGKQSLVARQGGASSLRDGGRELLSQRAISESFKLCTKPALVSLKQHARQRGRKGGGRSVEEIPPLCELRPPATGRRGSRVHLPREQDQKQPLGKSPAACGDFCAKGESFRGLPHTIRAREFCGVVIGE